MAAAAAVTIDTFPLSTHVLGHAVRPPARPPPASRCFPRSFPPALPAPLARPLLPLPCHFSALRGKMQASLAASRGRHTLSHSASSLRPPHTLRYASCGHLGPRVHSQSGRWRFAPPHSGLGRRRTLTCLDAGPWPTGADTWALRQPQGTYKGYSLPYTHGGP